MGFIRSFMTGQTICDTCGTYMRGNVATAFKILFVFHAQKKFIWQQAECYRTLNLKIWTYERGNVATAFKILGVNWTRGAGVVSLDRPRELATRRKRLCKKRLRIAPKMRHDMEGIQKYQRIAEHGNRERRSNSSSCVVILIRFSRGFCPYANSSRRNKWLTS